MRRFVLVAALLAVSGATALPASPASAASAAKAPCTFATLNASLQANAKKTGLKKVVLGLNKGRDFLCAGTWATAFPVVDGKAEITQLFRWTGKRWIAVERTAKICKSPGNVVPKAIYKLGCESN